MYLFIVKRERLRGMVSGNYNIEFVGKVWREEREPFGVLIDDFVGKFIKLVVWEHHLSLSLLS